MGAFLHRKVICWVGRSWEPGDASPHSCTVGRAGCAPGKGWGMAPAGPSAPKRWRHHSPRSCHADFHGITAGDGDCWLADSRWWCRLPGLHASSPLPWRYPAAEMGRCLSPLHGPSLPVLEMKAARNIATSEAREMRSWGLLDVREIAVKSTLPQRWREGW